MARVKTATKNRGGKELVCGRIGCGEKILPGEKYYSWTPFRSYKRVRCYRHYPRRSETTTSLMSELYAAIESAEDQFGSATTVDDVKNAMQEVVDAAESVYDQYNDACEAMGAAGEYGQMREMADEVEEFKSRVEDFYPDEESSEDEARTERVRSKMVADGFKEDDEAEWTSVYEERMTEAREEDGVEDLVEKARDEAQSILDEAP